MDDLPVAACRGARVQGPTLCIVIAPAETDLLYLSPSLGHPILWPFVRVQLYNGLVRSMSIDIRLFVRDNPEYNKMMGVVNPLRLRQARSVFNHRRTFIRLCRKQRLYMSKKIMAHASLRAFSRCMIWAIDSRIILFCSYAIISAVFLIKWILLPGWTYESLLIRS